MRLLALLLGVIVSTTSAQTPPTPKTVAIESLDPKSHLVDAKPGVVYSAKLEKNGLDETGQDTGDPLGYTYVLPEGFRVTEPRDVVIILHGHGLDATWGTRVYSSGSLGKDRIVVALDGTREDDGNKRTAGLDGHDVLCLRDCVLEILRTFPCGRVVIYGHSQGAFQALMFANQFPRLINGVVAHAGGLHAKIKPFGLRSIPTVFLHGVNDPVVPWRLSVDARDVMLEKEAAVSHLRRVYDHVHEANAVEANAAITFCLGMSTDKPSAAMSHADSLLAPRGGGANAPPFNLAHAVLKRFELDASPGTWPRGFKDATDDQKTRATALIHAIEAQGLRHVAALRTQVPDASALKAAVIEPDAPTPNWLGHLLAVREDFRGVESVESYLKDIDFAARLADHDEPAHRVCKALDPSDWGGDTALPKDAFGTVLVDLPRGFLFEPMPASLAAKKADWNTRAEEVHLAADRRAMYPVVQQYLGAIDKGRAAYRAINQQWKTP